MTNADKNIPMEGKLVHNPTTGEVGMWDGQVVTPLPGRLVTNEKTGQKALWDGKVLTPININIDPTQPTAQADQNLINAMGNSGPQMAASATPAQPTPVGGMTTPGEQLREDNNPFTQGGSAMATEAMQGIGQMTGGDGLLQKILGLARVANAPAVGAGATVGTTAQNILGNIPGLGGPGGVIPAGGAALADAATQLASGPGIIKGVIRGAKAVGQIAPRILAPGTLRRAGGEAIAQELGAPMSTLERVFTSPASKAAYNLAEAQPPVRTRDLANVVQNAFFEHSTLSNPNNRALKYLSNLEDTLRQGGQATYSQIMKEVQALKSQADTAFSGANPNNLLGKTLMDAREQMIELLDEISPLYRQANRLYRQEQATIDIMNAVRSGTPGVNFDKLIENSPDIARVFSPKVVKEITHIATELSDVASSVPAGGFRQFIQASSKPLTDMMASEWGRALLRNTLRTPKDRLPQALTAVVQTYRAMTPKQTE